MDRITPARSLRTRNPVLRVQPNPTASTADSSSQPDGRDPLESPTGMAMAVVHHQSVDNPRVKRRRIPDWPLLEPPPVVQKRFAAAREESSLRGRRIDFSVYASRPKVAPPALKEGPKPLLQCPVTFAKPDASHVTIVPRWIGTEKRHHDRCEVALSPRPKVAPPALKKADSKPRPRRTVSFANPNAPQVKIVSRWIETEERQHSRREFAFGPRGSVSSRFMEADTRTPVRAGELWVRVECRCDLPILGWLINAAYRWILDLRRRHGYSTPDVMPLRDALLGPRRLD